MQPPRKSSVLPHLEAFLASLSDTTIPSFLSEVYGRSLTEPSQKAAAPSQARHNLSVGIDRRICSNEARRTDHLPASHISSWRAK